MLKILFCNIRHLTLLLHNFNYLSKRLLKPIVLERNGNTNNIHSFQNITLKQCMFFSKCQIKNDAQVYNLKLYVKEQNVSINDSIIDYHFIQIH